MNRTVTMQQPKRAAALNIRTITMTALLSAMAYAHVRTVCRLVVREC